MKGCKEWVKKILAWKPDDRLVAAGALLTLLLLLLSLYRIAMFTIPWYDDYASGLFVKQFLDQEYSMASVLKGVFLCVRTQWYAWQGTFSSIAFMALMPEVWGEDLYFLGPWFLITILVVSVFVLIKVLVRDVLKGDWSLCIALQVIGAILTVEMMHTARSGLFWYNGGVHYVGMHSFLLLFTAALALLLTEQKKWVPALMVPLSVVGAFLASGANFVTALQGLLISLSLCALGVLLKNKRTFLMLPALAVYLVGFYYNISAPGNAVRAAIYAGCGKNPVETVLCSFREAVVMLGEFTDLMTIALLVLAVPFLWQLVGKSSFSFRFPLVVLLWSFCLYATGFAPSFYSLGHGGLGRTLNAVKITYQILLLLNEGYLMGWLCRFLEKRGKRITSGKCCWWFYPLMAVFMLVIFFVNDNPHDNYSSWGAYYFVHTSDAANYHQQYLERVEVIKNSGPDVVVKPYFWNPWTIRIGDLSDDPNREENRYMASWYGKNSITCREEETE